MPIYEYQCTKCGEIFEAFQRMTDEPLGQCKFCQSKVERLISHSSFQLKGSGWYLTDYARKNSSSTPDRPKKAEGTEQAADTKPAADSKSTQNSTQSKT